MNSERNICPTPCTSGYLLCFNAYISIQLYEKTDSPLLVAHTHCSDLERHQNGYKRKQLFPIPVLVQCAQYIVLYRNPSFPDPCLGPGPGPVQCE